MNIASLLGADRYLPISVALNDDPVIIITYIALYFIIAAAMTIIGGVVLARSKFGLVTAIEERPSLSIFFALIFVLMAVGSVIDTMLIFTAIYRLDLAVTGLLAGLSCLTAYLAALDFFTREGP